MIPKRMKSAGSQAISSVSRVAATGASISAAAPPQIAVRQGRAAFRPSVRNCPVIGSPLPIRYSSPLSHSLLERRWAGEGEFVQKGSARLSFAALFIQQTATSLTLGRSGPGDWEPGADPVGSGQPTENRTEAFATRRS